MPCPDDAYLLTTHHYGEAAIASVQAESHFEGIVVRELHAAQIGNAGSGQLQEVVDRVGRVIHNVQMVIEHRKLRNHFRHILDPLNEMAEEELEALSLLMGEKTERHDLVQVVVLAFQC